MVTTLGSGSIHRRTEEREPPEAALPAALSCAELVTMVALLSVTPRGSFTVEVCAAGAPSPARLPTIFSQWLHLSRVLLCWVQHLLCLWMLVVSLLWAL